MYYKLQMRWLMVYLCRCGVKLSLPHRETLPSFARIKNKPPKLEYNNFIYLYEGNDCEDSF